MYDNDLAMCETFMYTKQENITLVCKSEFYKIFIWNSLLLSYLEKQY